MGKPLAKRTVIFRSFNPTSQTTQPAHPGLSRAFYLLGSVHNAELLFSCSVMSSSL